MRSTTELKQHFLLLRRGRSLLSGKRDSNPRPPAWKASALSTELFPRLLPFSEGKRVAALWVRMDSNHRSRRQQIYSLPHLATLEHTHFSKIFIFGAERERASSRTRTNDRWITNLVLYQLSYRGVRGSLPTKKRAKLLQIFYMTKYFLKKIKKKMHFVMLLWQFRPIMLVYNGLFPFCARVSSHIHAFDLLKSSMRIDLRGAERSMTEQFLNSAYIRAVVQHSRSKSMP